MLSEEFGYSTIGQTRAEFRRLVLIRMKKEAKKLQVDLKPHYLEEGELYNQVIPDDEGDVVFRPISVCLPLVTHEDPTPQNQSSTEQGDELSS